MDTCPNCKFHMANVLTKCEAETVTYILKGLTREQIGEALFKSPKTIATFWSRAKKKLGVHDIFGIYRKWIVQKMLVVPDMKADVQYKAGYTQALADVLDPDLNIFTEKVPNEDL